MSRPISSPSIQRGSRIRPVQADRNSAAPTYEQSFVRATVAAVAAEIRKYAATISALRDGAPPGRRAQIDQALRDAFDNLD